MQTMSYGNYGYPPSDPNQPDAQQGWAPEADAYTALRPGYTDTPARDAGQYAQPAQPDQSPYAQPQPDPAYPASHSSAAYPAVQGSAAYPASQSSAAYAQPGYGQAGYPPPGPEQQPPAEQWGQPVTAPVAPVGPTGPKDDSPFAALVDFSFTKYATPGLVKIIYIAAGILGILWMLGGIIGSFSLQDTLGPGAVVLGILSLVFGLIGLLVFVLVLRVQLELALAIVRTATDVRELRKKQDQSG